MSNYAEGFFGICEKPAWGGGGGEWQDPPNHLNFLSSLFPTVSKTMTGLPCFVAHNCSSNAWEEEAGGEGT